MGEHGEEELACWGSGLGSTKSCESNKTGSWGRSKEMMDRVAVKRGQNRETEEKGTRAKIKGKEPRGGVGSLRRRQRMGWTWL